MSLLCKNCDDEVKTFRILYQKRKWEGAGKYAGTYEYDEEFWVDGGVFCSDLCLMDYLQPGGKTNSK